MMISRLPAFPASCERAGRVSGMILLRLALALVVTIMLIAAAFSADRPILKDAVVASSDVLTLSDLVEGVPAEMAGKALFRAPAVGKTGTIQARRILEAIRPLGLSDLETGGRTQVVVTRAARRIGSADIEAAVKRILESQHGLTAAALSIGFDGSAPSMIVAADVQKPVVADDVTYDRRSRRMSALVSVGASQTDRHVSMRVTGTIVEYVEVAVLTRPLNRGEPAQASDFAIEKRSRQGLPADAQAETQALVGQVARRTLQAGTVVRTGDLVRPEIVARGDVVTIVYEVPGLTLTLRGTASASGAQGDVIAVVNPHSKKTLHAQVVAPGKVSVSAPPPGRIAANVSTVRP